MKVTSHRMILAYQQAPWRVQMQLIGAFSLTIALIAVVAGVYLNVTARAANVGREIQVLQDQLFVLQRENADLETQLGYLTSAESMQKRAVAMGFQPVNSSELTYIKVHGYSERYEVVLAPPPQVVVAGSQSLPPEFTQTLFDWVSELTLENPSLVVQEAH